MDHLRALGNPLIKNLMGEGLDRNKVRQASDRVWKTLGAHEVPEDWRMYASGHSALVQNMHSGLDPKAAHVLKEDMPGGARICKGVAKL